MHAGGGCRPGAHRCERAFQDDAKERGLLILDDDLLTLHELEHGQLMRQGQELLEVKVAEVLGALLSLGEQQRRLVLVHRLVRRRVRRSHMVWPSA